MLQLVRKFSKRSPTTRSSDSIGAGTVAPVSGSSQAMHSDGMPRRPGPGGSHWSRAEAELLIVWEQEHRQVRVEMNDGRPRRTLILGVDLINNQLLIDTLMPAASVSQIDDNQPFWLVLPVASGTYHICVLARQFSNAQRGNTTLVDIITTRFARAADDIGSFSFSAEPGPATRLPTVALELPGGKQVRARLRHLSADGLLLSTDRSSSRDLRLAKGQLNCTIRFNEAFAIRCQVRADRSGQPAEATLAAFAFTQLASQDQSHLHRFLKNCAAAAQPNHAAA